MRTFLALVAGVSAGVALAVTLGGRALADRAIELPASPAPPPQPERQPEPAAQAALPGESPADGTPEDGAAEEAASAPEEEDQPASVAPNTAMQAAQEGGLS